MRLVLDLTLDGHAATAIVASREDAEIFAGNFWDHVSSGQAKEKVRFLQDFGFIPVSHKNRLLMEMG